MSMTKTLEVLDLTKRYAGKPAVDGLSFSVSAGEFLGLLGPNGAGKTTVLECILGTRCPEEGEVRIMGRRVEKKGPELFERIGVQFQNSRYPDLIRVDELYRMMAALYRNPVPAEELLSRFGLFDCFKKKVADLSGGMKQRLSLAMALINRPKLVFLDELTTGLDPAARRSVWADLNRLKPQGVTVVLTTHFMEEVKELCDRIIIMNNGCGIVQGTPEQVTASAGKEDLEESYLYYTDCGGIK